MFLSSGTSPHSLLQPLCPSWSLPSQWLEHHFFRMPFSSRSSPVLSVHADSDSFPGSSFGLCFPEDRSDLSTLTLTLNTSSARSTAHNASTQLLLVLLFDSINSNSSHFPRLLADSLLGTFDSTHIPILELGSPSPVLLLDLWLQMLVSDVAADNFSSKILKALITFLRTWHRLFP